MLKALNYFKGLVDSGAAPKRVATIKTYDDFNAAAQSGTTAMFFGGHWQHFQLEEAMAPDVWAKWRSPNCPDRPRTSARPAPAAGPSRHSPRTPRRSRPAPR